MNTQEIKAAIAQGLTVAWNNSGYIVSLHTVCPLHDLSVKCKSNGYMVALEPSEYDNCFIVGE